MLLPCPGCGALFPPSDGPTHRYLGASAGIRTVGLRHVDGSSWGDDRAVVPALCRSGLIGGVNLLVPSRA